MATLHRDIQYAPLPAQMRFHESKSRFKGYSGPVGSGKSMAIAHEGLRLAMINTGLLGLIAAPTYPMLRDVTQRAVFKVLDENELPYDFKKQENLLTLENGSEIIFRSMDVPEHLIGTNLAWFGVDELTYCKRDAWHRLQARLRHPLASRLEGFAAWTPKGFDWVYEVFIEKPLPGYTMTYASPRENIYLDSDYYSSLETAYESRFYEQEVLGKYLSLTSGQVYQSFTRTRNMKPLLWDASYPLCWALDFNVDPMCSVICQVIDTTSRFDMLNGRKSVEIRVLDEICLPNATIGDACREFIRRTAKWNPGRQRVYLYGDASGKARSFAGPSAWQTVREHLALHPAFSFEERIHSKNPEVRDRVNAVNSALCSAAGEVRVFIDPQCKELIRDLEQIVWKADSSGNLTANIDDSDPKRTHASSALGYLIEREMPLRKSGGYKSLGVQ